MDPRIFFENNQKSGAFRCTVTGNPCGTDTVMVGVECPRGGACQWREAYAAGYEHGYAHAIHDSRY